jgi:hypothetical protein
MDEKRTLAVAGGAPDSIVYFQPSGRIRSHIFRIANSDSDNCGLAGRANYKLRLKVLRIDQGCCGSSSNAVIRPGLSSHFLPASATQLRVADV